MNYRPDIESTLDGYLADGPARVPDRVVDLALDRIARAPQRHPMRVSWRLNEMTWGIRPALAGIVVLSLVIGGGLLATRLPAAPGTQPSPSPSPSAAGVVDTRWVPFSSSRYGYDIAYPRGWWATAATTTWGDDRTVDRATNPSTSWDWFRGPGGLFYAYSVAPLPGVSDDQAISNELEGCSPRFDETQPVVIDGVTGSLFVRPECQDAYAFVRANGRLHVFVARMTASVSWVDGEAVPLGQEWLLEAFLSRVRLGR